MRRTRRVLLPSLVLAALVAVWELAVRAAELPPFVLPAPTAVLAAGVRLHDELGAHLATTLTEAGLGLAAGAFAGAGIAVVVALVPVIGDAVLPLVVLTQTVPTVVLAPLLILWAGFGIGGKVVLVALTTFFPVMVATSSAMARADAELADMVRGLGGGRRDELALVRLPAALPGALAGLRIAATYAIGAAVVAEYLAGASGIGVFIQHSRKAYAVDQILVGVLLVGLVTGALVLAVDALSRRLVPWQRPDLS
ncbi:binding-protein-dependent transport systems inner membrane component [Beutenbergia cavernae DSM 12333]|uniref:Binding-protein-dependent transport systems inner membrane component n=1 Tax=Beutenbergia cavernae (strain ATCC BAA-8 / DSM 12333 / CCUG 43141 / JCM 11478 / NBRC 16432 / NCIMB 13614 / HKI 0122) TaxID=471853 RepID=C5BX40_BEUC1|nr:ABC transporter permease [Beutenbergia cavernae]ACQ78715.1 binding-protein-dependent transport systems inner membrane component [Beutenbergia cavernae DSM 12333]